MNKYYPGDIVVAYESNIGIIEGWLHEDVYSVAFPESGWSRIYLSTKMFEKIKLPSMPYYKWIQLALADMLELHKESKNAETN